MFMFKPIETISSKINSIPISQGQYIFCSDTNEIFIDNSKGERVPTNKSINIKKGTTTIVNTSGSVDINIEGFDSDKDCLMVYLNSVYLDEGTDYTINNETNTIECIDGEWYSTEGSPSIFNFVAFCNTVSSNTVIVNSEQPLIRQTNINNIDNKEVILLKYENALMIYTMMINNLNISNLVTEEKIMYFYLNSLWTKEMVYEAIDYGLIKKENFKQIL